MFIIYFYLHLYNNKTKTNNDDIRKKNRVFGEYFKRMEKMMDEIAEAIYDGNEALKKLKLELKNQQQ